MNTNVTTWRDNAPEMGEHYKRRVIEYITRCVVEFGKSKSGVWVHLDCAGDFVKVCDVFGLKPSGGDVDARHGMQFFKRMEGER